MARWSTACSIQRSSFGESNNYDEDFEEDFEEDIGGSSSEKEIT